MGTPIGAPRKSTDWKKAPTLVGNRIEGGGGNLNSCLAPIQPCATPHYFGGSRSTINSTKRYTICSVYLSPNAQIDMEEWKSLIRQLPRPFLLLGDFNAKHLAWDFENSADPRGRAVQSILVEGCVGMFNWGRPTHYHIQTNTFSAIDLCLCSVGELRDFQLEVDEDLHGSDHFPTYLTGAEYIPQHQIPRWIMDKANWDQFTEITEQMLVYQIVNL